MLNKYLEKIGKIKIYLIKTKKIDSLVLNSAIFGNEIPNNFKKYKIEFLEKLEDKKNNLLKIREEFIKDNKLKEKEKNILKKEISVKLDTITFLKKTYDIEANKIDRNYIILDELDDYDYYNEIFYGVSKKDIKNDYEIKKNKKIDIFIKKIELIKLLDFSKKGIPKLEYKFGNFTNLAHFNGTIKIPDKEIYNIREIITIFFHEMSHFFRYLNGLNNLGFNYTFSDYSDLEEGMALYNEYYFGNKIIEYGKHNPYYDFCYKVILENTSTEEKKDKIYSILKNKGFTKTKSLDYYNRFYRYSRIGGKNLFLKDMIYTKSYLKIKEIMKKNGDNYEKIMSGKIGLFEFENNFIEGLKNINSKEYFNKMVIEIKNLILKLG